MFHKDNNDTTDWNRPLGTVSQYEQSLYKTAYDPMLAGWPAQFSPGRWAYCCTELTISPVSGRDYPSTHFAIHQQIAGWEDLVHLPADGQ